MTAGLSTTLNRLFLSSRTSKNEKDCQVVKKVKQLKKKSVERQDVFPPLFDAVTRKFVD